MPDFDIEKNINSFIKYPNINWNQVSNVLMVSRKNKLSCYHSNEDLKNDRGRGMLLLDDAYFSRFIKELEKNYKKYQRLFKKLKNTNYGKISDKNLYNIILEVTDMWSLIISFFRFNQAEGTYYLIEELKKYVSIKEAPLLMLSPKLDAINLEQIDWQNLIKKPFSEKTIIKHVYKYPWVVSAHFTYEDAVETLKQRYDFDKNNSQEKNIKKEKQLLKKKQEQLIKKKSRNKNISRQSTKSCIIQDRNKVLLGWNRFLFYSYT